MSKQLKLFKNSTQLTKAEKMLNLLSDGQWHTTKELVRRVGHTFAVAKFNLTNWGYFIEKQSHPKKRFQNQYRLLDKPPRR